MPGKLLTDESFLSDSSHLCVPGSVPSGSQGFIMCLVRGLCTVETNGPHQGCSQSLTLLFEVESLTGPGANGF